MRKTHNFKLSTIWIMVVMLLFAGIANAQQTKRNIVANSNFEDGLKHWRWDYGLDQMTIDVEEANPIAGNKSAKLTVSGKKAEPWEQTFYYYLPIEEYAQYEVKFKIRSSIENATVRVELCQSEFAYGIAFKPLDIDSWTTGFTPDNLANPDLRGAVSVGTTAKEYSIITSGTQYAYPNYIFSFHLGHADIATYWIDDVKISRIDEGDWDGNLMPTGNFESDRVREFNNQGYFIDGRIVGDPLSIAELSTVDPIAGKKTFHIVKDANTPGTDDYWALSYNFQFWNNDVPKLEISLKAKSSAPTKIPMRLGAGVPWGWGGGDIVQWEVPLTTTVQEITLDESQAVNWLGKNADAPYADAAIPAYDWFYTNPLDGGFKGRMSLQGSLIDDNITQKGVEIWIDDLMIKEADLVLESFEVEIAPTEAQIGKITQFKIADWVYPTHAPTTVEFWVVNETGSATINQQGELVGQTAGEVKVYINTPNKTDEKEFTVLIIPAIDEPEPEIEHVYVKPINVSFGDGNYAGWNTMTNAKVNAKILNLIDNEGNPTQASLTITESFNAHNTNGPDATTTTMNLPDAVVKNNFFGNVGNFGGSFPKSTIKISGLYTDVAYDFEMFASRMGATDNRETYYKFTGEDGISQTVYLDASNNTANTVRTTAMKPDSNGDIIMEVGPGTNNTNSNKFFHLTLMRITPDLVAETVDFNSKINLSLAHGPYDPTWNVLGDFRVNAAATNLRDVTGKATDVSVIVTERFNNINPNGPLTTTTSMNMPSDASRSSYYGNSRAEWDGHTIPKSAIKFTGLDANRKYNFEMFAGRESVTDNRETYYKFTGKSGSVETIYLDASSNQNYIAELKNFVADDNGEIAIEIGPGPNNDNATGFYYLNALTIMAGDIVGIEETVVRRQAYPNPFTDMLNVFVEEGNNRIKIFGIDGVEYMSIDGLAPNTYHSIHTNLLPAGMYILQSGTQKSVLFKK